MNEKKLPDLAMYIDDARMIKKPELQKLLNISRSTLGRWIKAGHFPPPAHVINGRSMWHFQDYKNWLSNKHSKAGK
ncbi:AlpA family phage regulatory protein [Pseudoalteromonas sp. SG43-1]|uniref:helix-turn-helix transcriptional regulator n=1 Tax=Pseudoalteromonas TaxID=53246 RepID=UPI001602F316|nr:helix-turn-helix domain-containing protein [Pseudoalteromonas sp. SG43-1]MBB1453261.1 AlpA family phage regulatory protein [Pseudoalteromonas sp. SG43-1]|tara:strand:- start:1 stop:228 length:228 start_codon:yes stop_codon:yes gene_type:complete